MLRKIFGLGKRSEESAGKTELLSRVLTQIELIGPARQPLLLVSQIARSGGTLLSQLFDGHPQLWAHPAELNIGHPNKWDWPETAAQRSPGEVFDILSERKFLQEFSVTGIYTKGNKRPQPILFDGDLQRRIFIALAEAAPANDRAWLDIYFTSFFYAWLDYQSRYGTKKFVSAFVPHLALKPESVRRFGQVYPDGYFIGMLREPLGWYASVKRKSLDRQSKRTREFAGRYRMYDGIEGAEETYLANVASMGANREILGERYIQLDYDRLAVDTERLMRELSARVGLEFQPVLTQQTFNGMPIPPNTAFAGEAQASRAELLTTEETKRVVEGPMMRVYREAAAAPHAIR